MSSGGDPLHPCYLMTGRPFGNVSVAAVAEAGLDAAVFRQQLLPRGTSVSGKAECCRTGGMCPGSRPSHPSRSIGS